MMYSLIRSFLFLFTPEFAHKFTVRALHIVLKIPVLRRVFIFDPDRGEAIPFCGINFPNRVGLAAGFDKNGAHVADLALLGFGHIEVGTVTPLAQPGNPKPRLFRLPKDKALINRMGFNNEGVDAMAANLTAYRNQVKPGDPAPVIGGNIGKNKQTPNEEAYLDYERCYEKLYHLVDYFVINVSSPNTPGLRELQSKEPLRKIIRVLKELQRSKEAEYPELHPRPLLLKISPDLNESQIDDVIDIALDAELDGLIATNTTIDRKGLRTTDAKLDAIGEGGLSGEPLRDRAEHVIDYIRDKTAGAVPVIGVGGIGSVEDARKRIVSGAVLVQLYTGFIYGGQSLVKALARI